MFLSNFVMDAKILYDYNLSAPLSISNFGQLKLGIGLKAID